MSKTRIYTVHDEQTDERFLVRARSAAHAVHHVTRPRFAASVSPQEQLVHLLSQGVQVQDAGADPEGE